MNKTEIKVTATVADWTTVNAEEVAPKINVTVGYGIPGEVVRVNTFSFYRSLSLNDGYATGESENLKIGDFYRRVSELTRNTETNPATWVMNPERYWSNHNTHYQFRLVWPNTTTAFKTANTNPDVTGETVVQKWRPHVKDKIHNSTNYQVIEIWNDPFQDIDESQNKISENYHPYPSSLMIARPEFPQDNIATTGDDESDPICTNSEPGHTPKHLYSEGICATEGVIDLTFRYVMSQVEVYLTTTTTDSKVELPNAKVELVNVHKTGDVKLGDREVIPTGTKSDPAKPDEDTFGDYVLDKYTYDETTRKAHYHSAIVPQSLDGVKFRITITNTHNTVDTSDDTKDVYYADVAPIKVSGSSELVAPNGKWESGYHYVYNLNVSKTLINATATLEDWNKVEATEEVWF